MASKQKRAVKRAVKHSAKAPATKPPPRPTVYDEMLAALREVVSAAEASGRRDDPLIERCRALIARAQI